MRISGLLNGAAEKRRHTTAIVAHVHSMTRVVHKESTQTKLFHIAFCLFLVLSAIVPQSEVMVGAIITPAASAFMVTVIWLKRFRSEATE